MTTFATLLSRPGHDAWVSFQIAGFGPLSGADSTTQGFRLASGAILGSTSGDIDVASVLPCLMDVPDSITEKANLQDGSTELSNLNVAIRGGVLMPDGSTLDSLWQMTTSPKGYELLASISSTDTDLHIGTIGGTYPAVGKALYIGGETVVVSSMDTGTGMAVVYRGMYGSPAKPHVANQNNALYNQPLHLRGRRCWLRLNFFDPSKPGYLCPESEGTTLWSGTFDEWESSDRGVIKIACKSTLGRLDRSVGRQQWEGVASGFISDGGATGDLCPISCSVQVSPESQQLRPGGVPYFVENKGYCLDFYARVGDSLCQCKYWLADVADLAPVSLQVMAVGCMGTDSSQLEDGEEDLEIREVLPTNPRPRFEYLDESLAITPFALASGVTCHPIDIMLALLTSTGYAESGSAQNGEWDILHERWGLGIPVADLDLDSFRKLKDQTGKLVYPNLIIGWDGEPFSCRGWLSDEILSPMGWYLRVKTDGTIAIGKIEDFYPNTTVATIDYEELIADSFSLKGGLPETVSLQTWSYGWDWSTEKFTRVRKYVSETARDRLVDDDSEIKIECKGIDGDEATGGTLLGARSSQFTRWWAQPMPRLSFAIHLSRYADLAIGDVVSLANLDVPIFVATSNLGLIVSRGINLKEARLDLEMYLIPKLNTTLWSPSGQIDDYDEQSALLMLYPYAYTESGDTAEFEVGDKVMCIDGDGVPLSDSVQEIIEINGDWLTLDAWFTIGGFAIQMVQPAYLTFCRVEDSTAPEAAWTDNMNETCAQADSTVNPPATPDGLDPRVYGA